MAGDQISSIRFAIVGMGMGGLATALALAQKGFNHIDLYEYASDLAVVGAGIQLAPNMARILDRLGVWQDIEEHAVKIEAFKVRKGHSNEEIASVDMTSVEDKFGYPSMVGLRSSLAQSIYQACKRHAAIRFFFSSEVGLVHSFGPEPTFTVTPREGDPYRVKCDVLLAADGIKSSVRDQMLAAENINARIVDSGYAAYRILLQREQLQHAPELLELIDRPYVTRWLGEKRHILAYPVDNCQVLNIVPVQPDVNFADAPSTFYTTKGSKDQMMQVYEAFDPTIKRLLDLVPPGDLCEWRLRVHDPIPFWSLHQTALIGDACHPTLPHLGQGAAQAIEDGAALAVVFSKLPENGPEAIRKALRIYADVRKDRADTLTALAAASGRVMHAEEGAEQAQRDAQYAALKQNGKGQVPDRFADSDIQKLMYSVDIAKVAEDMFEQVYYS